MPTVIDSLLVEVGLDASGYTKGRKQVEDDFKKTGDSARKAGDDIEGAGKRGTEFFSRLRGELIALYAVFTAGKGIKEFISDLVTTDIQLGRMSTMMDISVQTLAEWRGAVVQAGGSADGVTSSLFNLSQNLQQFSLTGESAVIPYLRALGIGLIDGNGHLKTASELFLEISDHVKGMDPARATALLTAMGMDPGTIAFIMQGRKAIQEALDAQKGLAMTPADIAAGKEFNKNLKELEQESTRSGHTIFTLLEPAISAILRTLTAFIAFLEAHKPLLIAFFAVLTAAVLALSAAMVISFVGVAVAAMSLGFEVLGGGAIALTGVLGTLTTVALPALADAFAALGAAILATPVGWIIAGIAAISFAGYELYKHWDAVKHWWHHLWGDMSDDVTNAGRQIDAFGGKSPARASAFGGRGGGAVSGDDVAKLQKMGWTREQAIGIAANIQAESGGNARAVGDSGSAYGLAQWHPDRQAAFARWAGHDIRSSTHDEQLAFINYELRQGSEQKAGRALSAATDASQATSIITSLYERPANVMAALAQRLVYANVLSKSGGVTKSSTKSTHIGHITVVTQAKDATGIARDLRAALERNSLANQANGGPV